MRVSIQALLYHDHTLPKATCHYIHLHPLCGHKKELYSDIWLMMETCTCRAGCCHQSLVNRDATLSTRLNTNKFILSCRLLVQFTSNEAQTGGKVSLCWSHPRARRANIRRIRRRRKATVNALHHNVTDVGSKHKGRSEESRMIRRRQLNIQLPFRCR
jgi:hypothetical protein